MTEIPELGKEASLIHETGSSSKTAVIKKVLVVGADYTGVEHEETKEQRPIPRPLKLIHANWSL